MSWTLREGYLPATAFGACFKCRAAQRPGERVLDPNLPTADLPPYLVPGDQDGFVMFCESCIGEAANQLGYVTPLKHAELVAELAQAEADWAAMRDRAALAESALASLQALKDAPKPRARVATK